MSRKPIKRALVSVYDKARLLEVGNALRDAGIEIISTGSTCKMLNENGVPAAEVSDLTGFPEILGGRVKTLHPNVHSGILADQQNPDHMSTLQELDIKTFDLVVVNLYPFSQTVVSGASFEECIEQIDIGGPSMLRGAAKNHGSVAVICKVSQYDQLISAIRDGGFTLAERKDLAHEVFKTTAEYDTSIAMWMASGEFPDWQCIVFKKKHDLRYGENPHQKGALYTYSDSGIANAMQLHGKEMSYNNYLDSDAALRAALDHQSPCVAIIKHTNPCGIAIGKDISSAYRAAHACDPVSAFGGVIAANRKVTEEMAQAMIEVFTEVIIAPDYETDALETLKKKTNLRILKILKPEISPFEMRAISGGVLIQQTDLIDAVGDDPANWQQVAGSKVDSKVIDDLHFAWRCVRSVKSNAILLAKSGATVGIGMGQVNRVDSARLAVSRAADRVIDAVAASDAFFPFADGLKILIDAGVKAVVSPGGSMRDQEVIDAAKAANIPLFFTGTRHFAHS